MNTSSGCSLPLATRGKSAGHVDGIDASVTRRVRALISATGIGNGKAKLMLTPMTEMVPPGAAHMMASVIVWSAPTASITASAPRPPVAS